MNDFNAQLGSDLSLQWTIEGSDKSLRRGTIHGFFVGTKILSLAISSSLTNERGQKDENYEILTGVLRSVYWGDLAILMDDFNAQMGSDFESILGHRGIGQKFEKGNFVRSKILSPAVRSSLKNVSMTWRIRLTVSWSVENCMEQFLTCLIDAQLMSLVTSTS